MKTVRMCKTTYLGPTDTRGSRVKAVHLTTKRATTLPWDHALEASENHAAVAAQLFGRAPEFCCAIDGGGYMFGVDPSNDPKEA